MRIVEAWNDRHEATLQLLCFHWCDDAGISKKGVTGCCILHVRTREHKSKNVRKVFLVVLKGQGDETLQFSSGNPDG